MAVLHSNYFITKGPFTKSSFFDPWLGLDRRRVVSPLKRPLVTTDSRRRWVSGIVQRYITRSLALAALWGEEVGGFFMLL